MVKNSELSCRQFVWASSSAIAGFLVGCTSSGSDSSKDRHIFLDYDEAALDAAYYQRVRTFSAEPFRQSERELAKFDISDRIAEIRVPTLIIIGDHDPPDLRECSYLLHERIPGRQLFVVPGYGHWPAIERPDLFFPAVPRFLASTRQS